MINRLKEATGKEKFMLQQKLNRPMRLVRWKELYDPNNPANFGVVDLEQIGESTGKDTLVDEPEKKELMEGEEADRELDIDDDDDDEEEFNDDKDVILMEKLNAIDKKLEDKLAILDHTFGKKRRVLEEEIKDLAEERNDLTETKTRPLYRKGFDVKLVDANRTCKVTKGFDVKLVDANRTCKVTKVIGSGNPYDTVKAVFKALIAGFDVKLVDANRTCKVTKGGQVSFSAIVACGNYHGVIGFTKAKVPSVPIALQKIYLWPASTQTGMKEGKTIMIILNLVGFKNIKSKVIDSTNPYNTVKAVFKALNATAEWLDAALLNQAEWLDALRMVFPLVSAAWLGRTTRVSPQ